ncbi:hypothetical protein BLA29_006703, partial [Euroglyphus maynei]
MNSLHTPSSPLSPSTPTSDNSNFFWPSFRETAPSNHHRFARNKNPEYSIDDATKKREKAREYSQQLEQQIKEKNQMMNQIHQNERDEDGFLDQKLRQEQTEMRDEFDREHRKNLESKSMQMQRSSSVASLLHHFDDVNDDDDDKPNQSFENRIKQNNKLPNIEMTGSNRRNTRTVSTQTDLKLLTAYFDQFIIQ